MTIAFGPAKVHRVIRFSFQWRSSDALAAVIGIEQVARPQVIKKLWDSIKDKNLPTALLTHLLCFQ